MDEDLTEEAVRHLIEDTFCLPVKWNEAKERGNQAAEIFDDILEFKDVEIFHNLPKVEIIKKLDELQKKANQFEDKCEIDYALGRKVGTLAVAIIWIGPSIGLKHQQDMIHELIDEKNEEIVLMQAEDKSKLL